MWSLMHISVNFCNKCLTNVCVIHASSAWLGVCSAIKASTIHTEVKQLACTKCHKAFISIGTLENMSFIMDKGHLLAPCVTNYSKQRWLNKGNRKSSISLPAMWQIIWKLRCFNNPYIFFAKIEINVLRKITHVNGILYLSL